MPDLLEGHEPPVTLSEMIEECERELCMRKRVFPNLIERRRLSPQKARQYNRRLEALRDYIKRDLAVAARDDPKAEDLADNER